MIATCIGCKATENLLVIEADNEKFTICKKCDTALDEEIISESEIENKVEKEMIEKEMIEKETVKEFSDIKGDTIFVMGSPAEIKSKVEDAESKISNISVKIEKIEKARDIATKWINWHKDRYNKNLTKLNVQQNKLLVVNGIVEASKFTGDERFSKAELFGQSVDGELRVKIGGKWFNEDLQEFVKVQESKMSQRGRK